MHVYLFHFLFSLSLFLLASGFLTEIIFLYFLCAFLAKQQPPAGLEMARQREEQRGLSHSQQKQSHKLKKELWSYTQEQRIFGKIEFIWVTFPPFLFSLSPYCAAWCGSPRQASLVWIHFLSWCHCQWCGHRKLSYFSEDTCCHTNMAGVMWKMIKEGKVEEKEDALLFHFLHLDGLQSLW